MACSTTERLWAAGFYFGLAPAGMFLGSPRRTAYLDIHCRQALTLFGLLCMAAAILMLLVGALSYGMVRCRDWVEPLPTEAWLFSLGRKMLIVWAVFWVYGLWRAMRGKATPLPYLSLLTGCRFLHWLGTVGIACAVFSCALLTPLVFMADALVDDADSQAGQAYLLYDDLGVFPRRLFSFAMYPVARSATARWGKGSVKMLPVSRESIQTALAEGTFVFIGAHGTAQGLLLADGFFRPEDVPALDDESALRFVYLAGCDSGLLRQAWEAALHPASVKSYDRLVSTIEHFWWLWTQGPQAVRELSER